MLIQSLTCGVIINITSPSLSPGAGKMDELEILQRVQLPDIEHPPMPYTYTYASSSYAASAPSVVTPVKPRVPRYMRRYTIASSFNGSYHRPTSPLTNSFIPENGVHTASSHHTSSSHRFSSSNAHYIHSFHPSYSSSSSSLPVTRRPWSDSFPSALNPGPKVNHYQSAAIPSPSAPSISAAFIPSPDLNRNTTHGHPKLDIRSHSMSRSPSISSSVSSASQCSFYTASEDDIDILSDDAQAMVHNQSKVSINTPVKHLPLRNNTNADEKMERNTEGERLSSGIDSVLQNQIKHDWSESSGFASMTGSGFEYTSRGRQSTTDTEPEPGDDRGCSRGEKKGDGNHDYEAEWPLAYLTTVAKELEEKVVGEKTTRRMSWRRKFGRVASMGSNDEEEKAAKVKDSGQDTKKARKLKKKRPPSVLVESEDPPLDKSGSENERALYNEGKVVAPGMVQKEESSNTAAEEPHPEIDSNKEARDRLESEDVQRYESQLGGGSDEGWEYTPDQVDFRGVEQEFEEKAIMLSQGLPNSRTPQEILKGLEVVHEVEEEEDEHELCGNGLHDQKNSKEEREQESHPNTQEKGKQRASTEDEFEMRLMDMLIEQCDALRDALEPESTPIEIGNEGPSEIVTMVVKEETEPTTAPLRRPSKTRNKLSKRPSNRVSQHERKPSSSSKSRTLKGSIKIHTSPLKRASIVSLRPRRTPKTVMSSLRLGFLHSFTSIALVFGIDVGSRRLSRELQTPNMLVMGRHFSEKHIPRFPSRLDGIRSADKKVTKYE